MKLTVQALGSIPGTTKRKEKNMFLLAGKSWSLYPQVKTIQRLSSEPGMVLTPINSAL